MAGIDGLNSGFNAIRGFGGLASGLDRDSLIEGMTYGTTSKIAQQRQKKQALQWKQLAFQNISTKMIEFANKYTATMSSSTNLFSSSFWGKASAVASGVNSKYVSVSGQVSKAKDFSVLGVQQMAENARWTSAKPVDSSTLKTGELSETFSQENLEGKTITLKYGGENHYIYLSSSAKLGTAEDVAASINEALKNENVDGKTTLADVMSADVNENGELTFSMKNERDSNSLELSGGTAMKYLGFEEGKKITLSRDGDMSVTGKKLIINEADAADDEEKSRALNTEKTFAEAIAGKSMSFTYNGKAASITISLEDLVGEDGKTEDLKDLSFDDAKAKMTASIQRQLDAAYGKGKVEVSLSDQDQKLQFQTMKSDGKGGTEPDDSSLFQITGGSSTLVGDKGVFGIHAGDSNRVNMSRKLSDVVSLQNGETIKDKKFIINGVDIIKEAELGEDATINDLMKAINENEDIGVEVSYQNLTGQFTFKAKHAGAMGKIDIDSDTLKDFKDVFNFDYSETENADGTKTAALNGVKAGQDAVVTVRYGDSDPITITRDSNTFDLDGLSVTVKGAFGEYDAAGEFQSGEEVTFDVKTETEPMVKGIKDMIDQFNEILELVNKEVSTRPNRDYAPLTDEQRKGLSEDEIKLYEEKAKEGILYGDTDLRSLASDLRFIINPSDFQELAKIGISVSGSYSDNGKLVLDEEKLKAALESDPQKVQEIFTKGMGGEDAKGGIATNLRNVMDKYVKTIGATKGILIEKAGSIKAPASITKNSIFRQMEEIDKKIANFQYRLQMEQDRYIKQFTSLENLIGQMNNQSSWLSQFGGGY